MVLALPAAVMFLVARFEIEPANTLLGRLFTEPGGARTSALGVVVIWGSLLLLPHASGICLVPLAVARHSGERLMAKPLAILLALLVVGFSVWVWGSMFLDQLPCFLGVPNCD